MAWIIKILTHPDITLSAVRVAHVLRETSFDAAPSGETVSTITKAGIRESLEKAGCPIAKETLDVALVLLKRLGFIRRERMITNLWITTLVGA